MSSVIPNAVLKSSRKIISEYDACKAVRQGEGYPEVLVLYGTQLRHG